MRSSSETLLDWWKKLEQMLCTFMVLEVWRSCQWVATDVDSITKEARMFTSEQDFKEDLHWLLNQEVMVLRESQPIWSLKFWSLWFILALVSGEIKNRNGENEQTRKEEGDNSGRYKIPEPAPCVTLRSIACFSLSPLQLTNTFQTLHMPTLSPYKLSFCIPIFSPTHFYTPWNSITRLL